MSTSASSLDGEKPIREERPRTGPFRQDLRIGARSSFFLGGEM